ncbi:MAG: penicillin-binding transpeptidase domain-containing protein [Candidatus Limnocylindria bacterium]
MRPPRVVGAAGLAVVLLLGACVVGPSPTPYPTTFPAASREDAHLVVLKFLAAWRASNYQRMYELLAPEDRAAYPQQSFTALLQQLGSLIGSTQLVAEAGSPAPTALPPEPRPLDFPPPTPTPLPSGSASQSLAPTPSPAASASASGSRQVLPGPVPGLAVPIGLHFKTGRFGTVDLARRLDLTQGRSGWQVRWAPSVLFPQLASGGTLRLQRTPAPRGRILAVGGTVFAQNRSDGKRIYPQEWLAGQTIGYVSPVSAEDIARNPARDYAAGEVIGRTGIEYGADDLLRGTAGLTLLAVPTGGAAVPVLQRRMIPGADVTTTIRPNVQRTAQDALLPYQEAGTAVVDPKSGDVWALASAPAFNPNAMTIGATLGGVSLPAADVNQITNHALTAAYPAGSSFKPFTLAAALKAGLAGPSTYVPCPGTWDLLGFTFHNYQDHHLPGLVSLPEAMAFSCNTTYMPLALRVYERNPTGLTGMVAAFGFGAATGIRHIPEETGVLPDAAYFETKPRWDGAFRPYGPFDQAQLAIGQGDFTGTQLQLARAYAAFGNGGTLWVPRIVTQAKRPDGTVVEKVAPTVQRKIPLRPQDLQYIVTAIRAVVTIPYGTAYGAFLGFPIAVAGKSGTAETGGPDPDALFPAIAPMIDPTIAVSTILVRIHLGTGGTDAAPLVRRVMTTHFFGGG